MAALLEELLEDVWDELSEAEDDAVDRDCMQTREKIEDAKNVLKTLRDATKEAGLIKSA